jgi:ATP-dependent Lon protease
VEFKFNMSDDTRLNGVTEALPFMPLRFGLVLSPGQQHPIAVGTRAFVAAARAAFAANQPLALATMRDPDGEMRAPESVFAVGVVATFIFLNEMEDGSIRMLLDVKDRVHLHTFAPQNEGFYRVGTELWPDVPSDEIEVRSLARLVAERYDALRRRAGLPDEANMLLAAAIVGEKFSGLPWAAMHYLGLGLERHWISNWQRQELLEASSLSERLRMLSELLDRAEPPVSLASKVTPFLLRGASYL